MERAAADALYEDLHEAKPYHDGSFQRWSEHRSPAYPYHFRDGVTIWVSDTDLAPDDDFLSEPTPPAWPQPSEEG